MTELPPCNVCGGKGSGLHYGVITCTSCKGFFRRSIVRKSPYICKHDGKCTVKDGRGNCSGCRYKKCLEVGMSVDAIQMGRITVDERAERLIEFKDLQQRSEIPNTETQIVGDHLDPGIWHCIRTVTKQEDPQTSNTTGCTTSLQEKSITDDVAMTTCEKSSLVSVDGTAQNIQIPESDSFDWHDVAMTTSENTPENKSIQNTNATMSESKNTKSVESIYDVAMEIDTLDVVNNTLTDFENDPNVGQDHLCTTSAYPCGELCSGQNDGLHLEICCEEKTKLDKICVPTLETNNKQSDLNSTSENITKTPSENHEHDLDLCTPCHQDNYVMTEVKKYVKHFNGDIKGLKKWWKENSNNCEECVDEDCPFKNLEESFTQEVKSKGDNSEDLNVDSIMTTLIKIMDKIQMFCQKLPPEEVNQKLKEGSDTYHLKQELFGEMNTVPDDQYYTLYKTTGIDLDGRMKRLNDEFEHFENMIQQYIDFAKHIPGFCSLLPCDQASLLKGARSQFHLFLMHPSCDADTEMMMSSTGEIYHIKESVGWLPEPMLKVWMEFCKGIQNLKLSKKEQALVLYMMTISPCSKYPLKEPEKLQYINDILKQCISKVLMESARESIDLWYTMTQNLISSLQSLSEVVDQEHKSCCQMPHILDFLFNE